MDAGVIIEALKKGFSSWMSRLERCDPGQGSKSDGLKRNEETLGEAAYTKYRIVADNTYDWEYWVNPEGQFVYVSPSCRRISGYEAEEFLANSGLFMEIIHPEDKKLVQDHWREVGEETGVDPLEYRILCRDGTIRWIGHVCQPVYDEHGKFLGRRGSNRSITKRKQIEEELSASEKKYRDLVESANSIVIRWKPDGEITFLNRYAQIFFGYSPEEIVGKSAMTLVPDWDSLGQDLSQLTTDIVQHPDRYINTVNENVRKNGDRVWISWTNRAVVDEIGRVREILAIGNDITAQKRMEDALRASEERFRAVFESSSDCILVWDRQYNYLYANQAAIDHVGTTRDKVIGKNMRDGLGHVPDFMQLWMGRVDRVFDTGESFRVVDAVPVGDRLIYSESQVSPIRDVAGQVFAVGVVYRDVTERKRAEVELVRLASFPKLNPNPVIETDFEGNVHFTNPAAQSLFPDLSQRKLGHPFLTGWGEFTAVFREGIVKAREREAIANGHYYHQTVLFVDETQRIRIYGLDITGLKKAEEELRKTNRRLEILAETASRLLVSGRPQMIISDLCRNIMPHLDCQVFFNYLVDEKQDRLHLNACDGIPEETARDIEWLDFGVAVCGCVAREGRRIVAEHIFDTPDSRTDLVRSFGIQAYACHPLISEGSVIGTLSFGTRIRPSFTEDELAMMRAVADQVSIAMERVRYVDELKTARKDLLKSHDELESRVRERTEELWRTIARLETEVTERRKAEDALRESRGKLYDTLENITDGFFTLDRGWRFTYLNSESEKIWKMKREDLIGKNIWEISPAAVGSIFEEQYRKAMTERVSVHFEALSPLLKFWVEIRAYPIAEGIAVHARDISKRKKAEEDLQLATAYNRSLIEASLDPLVTIDPGGRISDVNAATENATGYSRKELLRTDFSDYFTEPEMARRGYRLVFQEGSVRDYPLEIRHRDGQVTPVLYNATVYRDETGKVAGVFADARDITRRLEMEKKLRESNEQLRALTSELVMAEERARRRIAVDLHDHVSQSLAVAKLRLETLQQKASESGLLEPLREVRDLINESIQQTRSLITELSPSVLYELGFNAAVEWLTEQVKTKHGVTIDLKSDLKIRRLDQDIQVLLFQTVRELLINIVKHAKANHASVTIREIGDHIRIRVMDDGVGFEKARLGNGMDREGGFGLFSIRERLQHFGGLLEINTRPGKGTSVTIEAPHKKVKKTQRRMRHVH